MKKILFIFAIILLLSFQSVLACEEYTRPDFCIDAGYDYTIATYINTWRHGYVVAPGTSVAEPFELDVSGNYRSVSWVSNENVDGVIEVSSRLHSYVHDGGMEGSFSRSRRRSAIGAVVFCGTYEDHEAPEFSVIASLAVLGLAGLYIFKKRA